MIWELGMTDLRIQDFSNFEILGFWDLRFRDLEIKGQRYRDLEIWGYRD